MDSNISMESMGFYDILHLLLHKEKVSRNEKDVEANKKVLDEIVQTCIDQQQWDSLNEYVVYIVERRFHIHEAVQHFIKQVIANLSKLPNSEARIKLLNTLQKTAVGKIHLEREHVDITKLLADAYETEGKIKLAADIVGDLKIESYGSLNQREKMEVIILQIRLMMNSEHKDKAKILFKKIPKKFLDSPENEDLKITFYKLKIELERWESYLETSKCYQVLSQCTSLTQDVKDNMLACAATFCALSPKCHDQINYHQLLLTEPSLKKQPVIRELLNFLASKELIHSLAVVKIFHLAMQQTKIADLHSNFGKKCLTDIELRILEHNMLTIAKYYSRITLVRMAELVEVSQKLCEEHITRLVSEGVINAHIDRFSGIVNFSRPCTSECVLDNWSDTLNKVMTVTNAVSHHVQKEMSITPKADNTSDSP